MPFSHAKKATLALGKSISGLLSAVCSAVILYKIWLRFRDHRKRDGVVHANTEMTTYHRLMVGISVMDIIHCLGVGVSTLAVPASTGVVFGHGTTGTCTMQGMAAQLATSLTIYTASLNTAFMLKIRYNIPDAVLRRRYEPWLHAAPIVFSLVTASLGASLKIFNPIGLPEIGCWVAPYPRGCNIRGGCTRGYRIGELLDVYAWTFGYAWFVISFFVVVVNSILIYQSIRKQERKNALYFAARLQSCKSHFTMSSVDETKSYNERSGETRAGSGLRASEETQPDDDMQQNDTSASSDHAASITNIQEQDHLEKPSSVYCRKKTRASRTAAVQSCLFCSATFLTGMWILMPWVGTKIPNITANTRFFLALAVNVVAPSQGIFTLFIFVRLQYAKLRKTEPSWSRWKCFMFCLSSPASNQ